MSNLTNTGAAHEPSGVETNPNSVLNGAYIATRSTPDEPRGVGGTS
jgi:hypothetical protein